MTSNVPAEAMNNAPTFLSRSMLNGILGNPFVRP